MNEKVIYRNEKKHTQKVKFSHEDGQKSRKKK